MIRRRLADTEQMSQMSNPLARSTACCVAVMICLAAVGCGSSQNTSRSGRDRQLLADAQRLKAEGLSESALRAFEMALEDNPNLVEAHVGIGEIQEERGDYEAAAVKYDTARTLDPTNFKATFRLGLMYQLLDRIRESIRVYLAALALKPDDFNANLNLATAYLQIDQPQLGLPYAEAAVKLDGESQAARVNMGSIYAALGQYHLAIEEFREAAELGELSPQIALNLADALLRTGRYERAKNTLTVLVRREPLNQVAVERLAYTHFKMGEYDKSLELYRESLALNDRDTASLNGIGVNLMTLYLRSRRTETALRDEAIETWQKSVRVDPNQRRIISLIARYRKL